MPEEILVDGEVRRLGWVAPSTDHARKMRATRTSITTIRQEAGLPPLIPESEWREVDFVTGAPIELINDQRDCSGCTGWSAAGGAMRQRWIRGQELLRLSGASVYAQINGGQDNGSNIIDAMYTIETHGMCLESEMDYPKLFKNQIPSIATWFREGLAATCGPFVELAIGLQMNMLPQFPIQVPRNWGWNGDGVMNFAKGYGNHSVYAAGLKKIAGDWFLKLINSWGKNWGPFKNGTALVSRKAVDACAGADDSYLHAVTITESGSSSGATA
jgi:hypothetical protein